MPGSFYNSSLLFLFRPSGPFRSTLFTDGLFPAWQREPRGAPALLLSGDALKQQPAMDRRRYPRFAVHHVITYMIVVRPPKQSGDGALCTASMLDLSALGMLLRSEVRHQPGQLLQFCERPVARRGIVRWCADAEDGGYFCGILLVEPDGDR